MRTQNEPIAERYLNTLMTWHVQAPESGGLFSLGEVTLRPGDEPPQHIHAREDETWYILEGCILFQRGAERIVRKAGQLIVLPRGVQHGFAVQSSMARILHFYTPGGIEQAFRSLSVALSDPPMLAESVAIEAVFQERGVTFVGPPLPVLLAKDTTATGSRDESSNLRMNLD
jgi:quercetin dioxygenase-like cupin family protein